MKQNGMLGLVVGGAVVVAALATVVTPGGWFLWIPLALVLIVFSRVQQAY